MIVRAFDFYTGAQQAACLAGTGTTPADDVSVPLRAAIGHAKTLTTPHFILDPGRHFTGDNTIEFDLPDGATLTWLGRIASTATAKPAVVIGSETGNRSNLSVSGVKVYRATPSPDTSGAPGSNGGSTGVRLVNLVHSNLQVTSVLGFSIGLHCIGMGHGFAYNVVTFESLADNRTNHRLSQSGGGYCNENNFICGAYNHNSQYPAVSTTNLLVDNGESEAFALNNNVFLKPSFEDNASPAGGVVAATINGESNMLIQPRVENPGGQAAYQIQFTANSRDCWILGAGFGLGQANISDLGGRNCYTTAEGQVLTRSTAPDPGKSVLTLRSTNSSAARALKIVDATGGEAGYIDCSGHIHMAVYFDASGNQLLSTRRNGWGAPSGPFQRGTFTPYVRSGTPTLAEIVTELEKTSQTLAALIQDSTAQGWIGA